MWKYRKTFAKSPATVFVCSFNSQLRRANTEALKIGAGGWSDAVDEVQSYPQDIGSHVAYGNHTRPVDESFMAGGDQHVVENVAAGSKNWRMCHETEAIVCLQPHVAELPEASHGIQTTPHVLPVACDISTDHRTLNVCHYQLRCLLKSEQTTTKTQTVV